MLQCYFLFRIILMLHLIIHVSYGISQENRLKETVPFRKQKSESVINKCSCKHTMRFEEEFKSWNWFVDVKCNGVSDISNLTQTLKMCNAFRLGRKLFLKFLDMKHIPTGTLRELTISSLVLEGQDISVDEDFFEGISHLKQFSVRESSIQVVPDFRIVKDSIQRIQIASSRLTSLEGKNLQNLTHVESLSFKNNSIRFIDLNVFQGTDNVKKLDLSHNPLTSIPWSLPATEEEFYRIYQVNGSFAPVHEFYSSLNKHTPDFHINPDTDIRRNLMFEKTYFLSRVDNPIEVLSEDSFLGKMPKMKTLLLHHCRFQEFDTELFLPLRRLEVLDLSYNLIEDVTYLFLYPKLTVKYLYLSGNKLQNLAFRLRFRNIIEMRLDGNKIKKLTNEDFKDVNPIEILQLKENQIRRIDANTFRLSKRKLRILDLSFNLIKSLNGSVRYLSNLQTLNLTYNLLQTFASDEFLGLNELLNLHLQYNHIKALGQLQNIPVLVHLSISHNDIRVITPDQIPQTLTSLHLAGNPLKCDCRLQPLILWYNESKTRSTDTDLCLQNDSVNNLHERSVCPEICSCGCTNHRKFSFMSVDCSSQNLSSIPEFLKNRFMKMKDNLTVTSDSWRPFVIEQNIHPSLHLVDRVLEINLENNNLESLEEIELHPNLTQLYLANNKLRKLPEFIFDNLKNLKQVSLSGNPWECDCNTIQFKKWLISNNAAIQDINNTRCGIIDKEESDLYGKVIWTLTDLDICPSNDGFIVLVIIGILVFLTLCLSAIILYSKYELNFKVLLYSYGFTFVKEKDLDYDKKFDAFLSFSHEDGEFVVTEIIREIQNKAPDVRLCIHYRDFKAGEFIYDNIMYAVQNSKKTVLFLSKNFLESEWCLMEFQVAHVQSLKDKVHRIIVIKIGDLPKKIDPKIKLYLESTTYLTWGEKYFWKKLLYILPSSNSIRNPVPRSPETIQLI